MTFLILCAATVCSFAPQTGIERLLNMAENYRQVEQTILLLKRPNPIIDHVPCISPLRAEDFRHLRISSAYGTRLHPLLNEYKHHAGIDLPGNPGEDVRTSNINVQLANDVNAPFFLKKYLAMPEYKDYDIAIIDCAPALDAIIINAITAGDAMLISLSPGEFSYDGMRRILSASNTIKKNYGAKIQLGGIILSMINARTKVYQQTVELLRADDLLPDAFNTNIRLCEAFKQAEAEHKTIFEFAPKSKGADDMSALTDEIIAKLLQ